MDCNDHKIATVTVTAAVNQWVDKYLVQCVAEVNLSSDACV